MNLALSRPLFWAGIIMMMARVEAVNKSFEQGSSWLQSHSIPIQQDPQAVPGYGGKDLPQSQMKATDLGSEAQKSMQDNEASHLVVETAGTRQKYVVDSKKDPLIVAANQALADHQKTAENMSELPKSEENPEEIQTCEEGGDEYPQTCTKRLEIVLNITPETRTTSRHCPGHSRKQWQWHGFKSGYITVYYSCGGCTNQVSVIPKKIEIVSERWLDDCVFLEDLVDKGLCRYVSTSKSPHNETRMIQGEPQTRDHFEEYYQYACFKTSEKSCAGLRAKGCYQTNSICKEKIGDTCILWEQTYRCPPVKKSMKTFRTSNKENPFCFGGDCADTSYEANQDFGQVMSQMAVLKEAQEDLRKFATIFRGRDRRCTRNCLDFRDCCGSLKGWGVSFHLSNCDADERDLRELRDLNRCVMVGTYCAEKLLDQCIRKKTTFCCYDSKLAKMIQEQGRRQIGLGFGSPEHPHCQGLTAEQLSQIDFSRVDFSEVVSDIAGRTKALDPQKITQSIQQSMKDRTGHLTNPTLETSKIQGRVHGDF